MSRKLPSLLFYLLCAFALASVLRQMLTQPDTRTRAGDGGELEQTALAFYRALDAGDYGRIVPVMVEGRWSKGAAPREYHFHGLLGADELREHLVADFGDNGWMIRFVSLEAIRAEHLPFGETLGPDMEREEEIVRHLELTRGARPPLAVVTLTGHVTGRCNIINWERRLPLAKLDGAWVVVSRGTPEDYELVRREQWFKPIRF